MLPLIANILHQDTIRRLSGDGAFERGRAYFQQGRVEELARKEGSVQARVRGAETYDVRIWMKDEKLAYACSCPQGQDQAFCKHAVAVALAFVGGAPAKRDDQEAEPAPSPVTPLVRPKVIAAPGPGVPDSTTPPRPSLADSLRALSHEQLVVLVLEAALDDGAFRERLTQRLSR